MPRYSAEVKAQALQSIAEHGVSHTSKEMHIALQTLYKWRNAAKQAPDAEAALVEAPDVREEARNLLAEDNGAAERIAQLEAENARLAQMLAEANATHAAEAENYRSQIARLKKVIAQLLEDDA